MSEYTTIYLRRKEIPLLKYKEHPSYEECQKLPKEDLMKVNREIDEYNKQVTTSFGCKLFYLSTTPSRELTMLPWSPSSSILTKGLLDEILYFYREEIDNYKNAIAKNKEDISKANVNLYDRISKEIDECHERINFEEKELEHCQYLYNKFAFCSGIINNESNSEYYELIYTKS